jgi:hypothetical protein
MLNTKILMMTAIKRCSYKTRWVDQRSGEGRWKFMESMG